MRCLKGFSLFSMKPWTEAYGSSLEWQEPDRSESERNDPVRRRGEEVEDIALSLAEDGGTEARRNGERMGVHFITHSQPSEGTKNGLCRTFHFNSLPVMSTLTLISPLLRPS